MTVVEYRCIHCMTPCDSLYRKYGTSSYKLSQCPHCQSDVVDPYCERDWLLVNLDCLLLRDEAYRHVLFHRWVDLETQHGSILLASSVLRTYLVRQSEGSTTSLSSLSSINLLFLEQVLVSAMLWVIMVGIVYGILVWMQQSTTASPITMGTSLGDNKNKQPQQQRPGQSRLLLWKQVYLAILLPTLCQAATLLVHIWEPSQTVRQIGSVLVLIYQWMGIINLVRATKPADAIIPAAAAAAAAATWITALCIRALFLAAWNAATEHRMACPGLEWNSSLSALPLPQGLCLA